MSNPAEKSALYILDVFAIVYRSYFAFLSRPLRNPSGENVSAVYGFFRFLFSLFDQRKPEAFVAAFDSKGKTFRHEMFDAYKATRQKTPEDLIAQVPMVEEILKLLGAPMLRAEGFEADDVIATLARRCKEEGRPCFVISGDKDLLQLVGGSVKALRPQEGFGFREMGPEEVVQEWGVGPETILDYLSLTGDASDNVPGVSGIGEKTARKLLGQFDSIDDIYSRIDEVSPESLKAKLEAGMASAYLSRKLITLSDKLDLGVESLEELCVAGLDRKAAAPIFLREGMKSLALEYGVKAPEKPKPAADLFSEDEPPAANEPVRADETGPRTVIATAEYRHILEETELSGLVDTCIKLGEFAFDTETDSLDSLNATMIGFSLACEEGKAFYIPLSSPEGLALPKDAAVRQLSRLFASRATAVGHNIKFDFHVVNRLGLTIANPVADTMIAAWVLDAESNAFGLESLAEKYLGLTGTTFESIVPKGSTFASVPLETATHYAAEDSDFTLRLWKALSKELDAESLRQVFGEVEMPLVPILARMEERGITVNAAELRKYGVELESELRKIEKDVWELVGHEFNLASTKQLQEVLFTERRLPTQKRTKTGFSTDTAVLEELAPLDPVPELILRQRLLSKLKSTYVDTLATLAETAGTVHTTYSQTGAATGRLSSRDPNLQNIPIRDEEGRRIRASFTARPGQMLISADYSQIELVVMAHLSQDENLMQAFREGVDIHRRTAGFIFGIEEKDVLPEHRRVAKTINFGVIYGMSAFRLARDLRISNSKAQAFIDAYFTTYSGVARFIQKTIAETEKAGFTTTMFGRRRKIAAINSSNRTERQGAQRVAVNTPIQGSAADIMKLAMIKVDASLRENLPEAKLLLQVHDELVLEAPEALAAKASELVKAAMESAASLSVPLRASIETAYSWGGMH
jgi:DNA polymerase-1